MSLKEHVNQELERLDEADLRRVAEYLDFLKFRARRAAVPPLDESYLAALYAEFAEEDRALAEAGMTAYAAGLATEDAH